MFDKRIYEERLVEWRSFRLSLENSNTPILDTINFYNQAPKVSIHTDPWTQDTWPDPWELINENQYCEFAKVLGICYTLQLTERFKSSVFEIHIGVDDCSSSTHYLLVIDNFVINWDDSCVEKSKLPSSYISQKIYSMPELQ